MRGFKEIKQIKKRNLSSGNSEEWKRCPNPEATVSEGKKKKMIRVRVSF